MSVLLRGLSVSLYGGELLFIPVLSSVLKSVIAGCLQGWVYYRNYLKTDPLYISTLVRSPSGSRN